MVIAMHARLPKNFCLEERLERYADAIELVPNTYQGSWIDACTQQDATPFQELWLDVGCGKGTFICAMAKAYPHTLFVGVDAEPICIAYTAQKICEQKLSNAVVVAAQGQALPNFFGQREVSRIFLNYPTPFPRKRDAHARLVSFERLLDFRQILKPSGVLHLRTDSYPLFLFAQDMLEQAGYTYEIPEQAAPTQLGSNVTTEYEMRLKEQGAPMLVLQAQPSLEASAEIPEDLSLYDYFPEDLETMDYVPYGMGAAYTNFRNYRKKHHTRDWSGAT